MARPKDHPDKLTDITQGKIVAALKAGAYIETAAAFAGISRDTLYRWLKLGARKPGTAYSRFADAVALALAESEIRDLAIIGEAAKTQWQAAAWRLERRNPARWGRRTEQPEATGDESRGYLLLPAKVK